MRFGYGWLRKSVAGYQKQIAVGLGLMAVPVGFALEASDGNSVPVPPPPPHLKVPSLPATRPADPRITRLSTFLSRLHCPVSNLAADFVRAADENNLDWRLLPSISVVESGGGKAYRNNNIFGWNNGTQTFATIRAGIREVAFKLGRSPLYRNRDSRAKLKVYNPDESYGGTVLEVMKRISPTGEMRNVSRRFRRPVLPYALENN